MTAALLAITRPPTRLGDHVVGGVVTVAVIAGLWLAMRRGWRRRAGRQAHVAAPAPLDAVTGPAVLGPVRLTYLGTTLGGHWLERVVAHGLGSRSAARLAVSADGLRVERPAARSFSVLAPDLCDARVDRAHAGRLGAAGAVVVVGWRLGETPVESGFQADDPAQAAQIVAALRPLVEVAA